MGDSEYRTFTENGGFAKEEVFEKIWVAEKVKHDYDATDILSDEEYLDYNLWCDMNTEVMYRKHLPHVVLCRGKNPNIIFHGGCLGCLSQRRHGFERCMGCLFFRFDQKKLNLHIEGEEYDTMSANDLRDLLGGD